MQNAQRKYAQTHTPEVHGDAAARREKKPYTTPRLTRLGRLEEGDPRRSALSALGR